MWSYRRGRITDAPEQRITKFQPTLAVPAAEEAKAAARARCGLPNTLRTAPDAVLRNEGKQPANSFVPVGTASTPRQLVAVEEPFDITALVRCEREPPIIVVLDKAAVMVRRPGVLG